MAIEKGSRWGHAGSAPADVLVAGSDAELAELVADSRAFDPSRPPITTVTDGDLLRTLGGGRPAGVESWWFPLDLAWVELEGGEEYPFVAHAVARRSGWRGEGMVAMNAAWMGPYYLGPRAHPNDGLLDVTHGRLPLRQVPEARRRARTGTHVPHPALSVERTPRFEMRFSRRVRIRTDGVIQGSASKLVVRVQPDAFWVVL